MFSRFKLFLSLLIFILIFNSAKAFENSQGRNIIKEYKPKGIPLRVTLEIKKNKISLAEYIELSLKIKITNRKLVLLKPLFLNESGYKKIKPIENSNKEEIKNNSQTYSYDYKFEPILPGKVQLEIPTLNFQLSEKGKIKDLPVKFSAENIEVTGLVSAPNIIGSPGIYLPNFNWLYLIPAGLLSLILLSGLIKFKLRHKVKSENLIEESPIEISLKKIDGFNLAEPSEIKLFYLELNKIIFNFLTEKKFKTLSFKLTNSELFSQLENLSIYSKEQLTILKAILNLIDLVTFCSFIPTEKDHQEALSNIKQFITK